MRILYIVGAIAATALTSYLGIAYYSQKQMTVQLNQVLDDTLKEKEQLQNSIVQIENQLKEKNQRLAELSDVEMIKTSLNNARKIIEDLNNELAKVNNERASYQNANISLKTRLENSSKEYMSAMSELKTAQDQLFRLNKEQSPDKRRLEELNRHIADKNQEISRHKDELDSLKSSSVALAADNKILEKKLKDLESSRNSLQAKLESMKGDIGGRETPLRQLQVTIASLRTELADKEEKILELEEKLARQLEQGAETVSVSAKSDPKSQKILDQMRQNNQDLKDKIAQLNEQLDNERSRSAKLASSAKSPDQRKFDEVKVEMERLSGILIKKEFEIDTAKKDALASKEELVALQGKLASAQDNLYTSRVNQEKLKELENQRLTMQSQLNQVQQDLLKKNELIESLQKNIDYLTLQVEKKDREKAQLDARLSLLESTSKGEIDKEKKRSEEVNMMYSSLKAQISQFSEGISLKEAEIENKRKEISLLREESSSLKTRLAQLENDLYESRENQKKIMGDLSAAVRLNSVLQERFRYAPSGQEPMDFNSSSEDKKKADELKKKIEVILEPERQ